MYCTVLLSLPPVCQANLPVTKLDSKLICYQVLNKNVTTYPALSVAEGAGAYSSYLWAKAGYTLEMLVLYSTSLKQDCS